MVTGRVFQNVQTILDILGINSRKWFIYFMNQ